MNSNVFKVLILIIGLQGCEGNLLLKDDHSNLSRTLLGHWQYEDGPNECRNHVSISFRKNGTYSRSAVNCSIATDSFGEYFYGWYVVDNYICFASNKDELKSKTHLQERCKWKVVSMGKSSIVVRPNDELKEVFTLLRTSP